MSTNDLSAIAESVNQLLFKQMVSDLAIQELIRVLPETSKATFSKDFRKTAVNIMQTIADSLSPTADSQISLSVAAFLEAAGSPPNR